MDIKRALSNDRLLRAVIGMGRQEFKRLLNLFTPYINRTPYKRGRRRKAGAGRKYTLQTGEEKLFYPKLRSRDFGS